MRPPSYYMADRHITPPKKKKQNDLVLVAITQKPSSRTHVNTRQKTVNGQLKTIPAQRDIRPASTKSELSHPNPLCQPTEPIPPPDPVVARR
jgi:hypothetical protein